MAYIGNTVQNQGFAPAVDYFNGDGTTVTFTLSRPVASVAQLTAVIDNVIQNPSSAFTVSGNAITFTSAPLSGTNNIWVEYTSLVTTYAAISQDPSVIGDITASGGYLSTGDFGNSYIDGTIVDYVTGNARITTGPLDNMTFYHGGTASRSAMMDLYYAGGAKIYGTTALTIPVGTTAERPGTPAAGMMRLNTTLNQMEWYSAASSAWVPFSDAAQYTVDYLVVAGGGGGGTQHGGGGGAGGFRTNTGFTLNVGTAYTVTVGAGGAGSPGGGSFSRPNGSNGSDSVFSIITSTGGGGGSSIASPNRAGSDGGSGGGGALDGTGGSGTSPGGSGNTPSTSPSQGNNGGTYTGYTSSNYGGGAGGGGASAVGQNAPFSGSFTAGAGGAGTASGISGSSVTYAGGGGGGSHSPFAAGAGGSGGGGTGGTGNTLPASTGNPGTANTGGGGGGGGSSDANGGTGGSGIVVIRYPGTQKGTGGTVTSSGGYTIHTFTSSGTYTA